MSLLLQQTKDEVTRALALAKQSDIVGVRIVQASLNCGSLPDLRRKLSMQLGYEPLTARQLQQSFSIQTSFWFKAFGDDLLQEVVIDISCVFESHYEIADTGFSPGEDQLEAFRRGNAVFNAWPYFREFVQSAVTRMGATAPPVPFLRLVPKNEPERSLGSSIETATALADTPEIADKLPRKMVARKKR